MPGVLSNARVVQALPRHALRLPGGALYPDPEESRPANAAKAARLARCAAEIKRIRESDETTPLWLNALGESDWHVEARLIAAEVDE